MNGSFLFLFSVPLTSVISNVCYKFIGFIFYFVSLTFSPLKIRCTYRRKALNETRQNTFFTDMALLLAFRI